VQIYDFGRAPTGLAYIAMELLEGETLAARIKRGPASEADALALVRQVAAALAAAHAIGVVHRDLKPSNIFLAPDPEAPGQVRVKLLDFGIAKLMDGTAGKQLGAEQRTQTGAFLGTPAYMSPEQCRGVDVDHRTDIYALGCILYELLAGQRAFMGETAGDLIVAHIAQPAPLLKEVVPAATPRRGDAGRGSPAAGAGRSAPDLRGADDAPRRAGRRRRAWRDGARPRAGGHAAADAVRRRHRSDRTRGARARPEPRRDRAGRDDARRRSHRAGPPRRRRVAVVAARRRADGGGGGRYGRVGDDARPGALARARAGPGGLAARNARRAQPRGGAGGHRDRAATGAAARRGIWFVHTDGATERLGLGVAGLDLGFDRKRPGR
jgi:hypothetical protein